MDRLDILKTIQDLLVEITDNEELVINEESSPATTEDWDSLTHFNLVMELQNEYGIKFGAAEIQGWKNVGDIITSIENKS